MKKILVSIITIVFIFLSTTAYADDPLLDNWYIGGFLSDDLGGTLSNQTVNVNTPIGTFGPYDISNMTTNGGLGGGLKLGTWWKYFGLEGEYVGFSSGIPSQTITTNGHASTSDNNTLFGNTILFNVLIRYPFESASGQYVIFPYAGVGIGGLLPSMTDNTNSNVQYSSTAGLAADFKVGGEVEWLNGLGLFLEYRLLTSQVNFTQSMSQIPGVSGNISANLTESFVNIGAAYHF